MAAPSQNQNNTDLFDAYFRRADLDGDGQISGAEAVAFFQGANLPKIVLAQVWMHADQKKLGYLSRQEFYNALKLVTVAQSKRELTPDIVKAALYSPASARIPAPQINLAATPATQPRVAASLPQSSAPASPSQNLVGSGTPGFENAGTNQQFFSSQQSQLTRPPQPAAPCSASPVQHVNSVNLMPRGGATVAPRPSSSNVGSNWLGGSMGGPSVGIGNQVPNQGIGYSTNQSGFGLPVSGPASPVQQKSPVAAGQTASSIPKPQDLSMPSNHHATKVSQASVASANGFASDSLFGDVFAATPSQPTQTPSAAMPSTSKPAVSTASIPSYGPQPSAKPSPIENMHSKLAQHHVSGQHQQVQPPGKTQQVVGQSTTTFTGTPRNMASSQSAQSQPPWPKMTQSDVQKYTKVFMQVDTDRDGKIMGDQARNLFLSWRLPREVLKQVWDLSDQDNDSMLSLREFCTALYLMERFREGRPLPSVLPIGMIADETLFPTSSRPSVPYGGAAWGSAHGFQQPQVMNAPRPPLPSAWGRPPRPALPQSYVNMQPGPQKAKVPVLEKHLVDQLSQDEQDSLDAKFKEATEANKKVEELEKDIKEAKAKIEFYRVKMQELVLYKSRCDNRLNEITERVSADKREVEALAKKYEEKFRQSGNVASRLTLEEATFRDIQERKMELYQAIVKFETEDTSEGALQDRANHIQQGLEELVKNVNERSKQYGLRSKATSLVELPFGWQPGIQEGAADWDGDWDKFEDEGFTFVKELTLDVQNVIAPPKPKSSIVKKETASNNEGANPSAGDADANSGKAPSTSELTTEKDSENDQSENRLAKNPSDSPAENGSVWNQSQEPQSSGADGSPHAMKSSGDSSPHAHRTADANGSPQAMKFDGSPHAKETRSDHGGAESIFSGEKSFDEPSWGHFDTHYDTDSVWGGDDGSKDADLHRFDSSSLLGFGDFNIKPIKIQSDPDFALPAKSTFSFDESVPGTPAYTDNFFPGQSSSSFADSVPSTPAYVDNLFKGKNTSVFADSVPSTPAYADNLFEGKGSSVFADSVPSTLAYADNSFKASSIFADSVPSTPAYSQRGFGEGSDDHHSFDSFSRFDSFNLSETNFSQGPYLARFDSVRSTTTDYDQAHGFGLNFDSFNSHDGGTVTSQPSPYLARFDSTRSTSDFDQPQPSPYLARFDSTRSTSDFDHSHQLASFDETDAFGSSGPFRTTKESQTPIKDTDHWSAF